MSTDVTITSRPGAQALADLYRDLHRNPELSFAETRTAGIVAASLAALGYEVTTGVGGTGVVGIPNHSPQFAPVIEPTLSVGVAALVAAAKEWLGTA